MIRFYLGEGADPQECADLLLCRARGSRLCARQSAPARRQETRGSGGYGMLVGPQASVSERAPFAAKLKRGPRTTSPSRRWRSRPARPFVESGIAPRHVDLRPFVLSGQGDPHPCRAG